MAQTCEKARKHGVWRGLGAEQTGKLGTLSWDEEQMTGTLTCGVPLKFDAIDHLDVGKWEPKQILVVCAKDGRRVTLDAWHHAGARELAERLLSHEPPYAVTPGGKM